LPVLFGVVAEEILLSICQPIVLTPQGAWNEFHFNILVLKMPKKKKLVIKQPFVIK